MKVVHMNGPRVPRGTELTKLLAQAATSDADYEKRLKQLLETAMDKAADMEYALFEKGVRENAVPPVRGELTEGKMRWRGIRRVYDRRTGQSWLEQRGQRITEVFTVIWK